MPNKSAFQFTNPELISLEFEKNGSFQRNGRIELPISLRSTVNPGESDENTDEQKATVSIEITVGSKDSSEPFFLKATESANFKWKTEDYSDEQINALLSQNAVALLISYVRPVIASITATSGLPVYNLPFLNLSSLEKKDE